ncbi:MAG: hypothetical protein CL583_02045 [Alteromonadaceae bacterium]|nr:hypothetical protein [Alteromonadaceae bacterium]
MKFAARKTAQRTLTVLFCGLFCGLLAVPAVAQTLKVQLETALAAQPAPFTGFETAAEALPDAPGADKYLVLDFRFAEPQPEEQLQASIHRICQTVLLNQQLVKTLSDDGFNRLAVAFDRESQYDCF